MCSRRVKLWLSKEETNSGKLLYLCYFSCLLHRVNPNRFFAANKYVSMQSGNFISCEFVKFKNLYIKGISLPHTNHNDAND